MLVFQKVSKRGPRQSEKRGPRKTGFTKNLVDSADLEVYDKVASEPFESPEKAQLTMWRNSCFVIQGACCPIPPPATPDAAQDTREDIYTQATMKVRAVPALVKHIDEIIRREFEKEALMIRRSFYMVVIVVLKFRQSRGPFCLPRKSTMVDFEWFRGCRQDLDPSTNRRQLISSRWQTATRTFRGHSAPLYQLNSSH